MDKDEDLLSRSVCDERNPIKKIIIESPRIVTLPQGILGPKIESNVSFKLQDKVKFRMRANSISGGDIIVPPDSSPPRTLIREQTQTAGQLNIDTIKYRGLAQTSNRKTSISRFSRRFPQGISRVSITKRKRERSALAHLTLQDLLFRQKLDRFIKNIRAQSGLNDAGKLTVEQLNIINDSGASVNEILKQNNNRRLELKRSEEMKKKVKTKN